MKCIPFQEGWLFGRTDENKRVPVTLPHDAMISEPRLADSAGGTNTGFFREADYVYEKEFTVPEIWKEQEVWAEFEGIYHHAEISVNGSTLACTPNGYMDIRLKLDDYLHEGKNTIRVIARNAQQPSSRWYSGAGIYRPAHLRIYPKVHIVPDSICIRTLDYRTRSICVDCKTTRKNSPVKAEILSDGKVIARKDFNTEKVLFKLSGAGLWSPEHPVLYVCRLTCGEDVQEVTFGIRQIACDAGKGLCINGERVLLLGACIHHDNGIIGAWGHPFAEKRKIALLKAAGFNAVRSAHNPVSKAVLNACDELGVLVLDEYVDMWYIHKTRYDYASFFEENWRRDLEEMVIKDRNHPSVIMYSIGNEVSETAQEKGIALTEEMCSYLHELDERPVTCGINIFFNNLSSLGLGVYSDEKAQKTARQDKARKKAVGSEFINRVAGLMGAGFMKFGATLHGSDVKTRDAYARLDVAGYNYGVKRYKKDVRRYPERVILGSETFAEDAAAFYDLAAVHPAIIGDFVWTGMDYLGEVGLGAWEYKEYASNFNHGPGWLTAGAGTLDLTGASTCQMAYMQVAYGLSPVRIGVVPVPFAKEKHSPAAWRFTNAVESWSWEGCEGKRAFVEVYARGDQAELELNGKKISRKRIPASCRVKFRTRYEPGTLTAVVYNADGHEVARTSLTSASGETRLTLVPEQEHVGEHDLIYVRASYTDEKGTVKPLVRGNIRLTVQGGKLAGFGNACSYNLRGYQTDVSDTYYGQALAVIVPFGKEPVTVSASSEHGDASVTLVPQ